MNKLTNIQRDKHIQRDVLNLRGGEDYDMRITHSRVTVTMQQMLSSKEPPNAFFLNANNEQGGKKNDNRKQPGDAQGASPIETWKLWFLEGDCAYLSPSIGPSSMQTQQNAIVSKLLCRLSQKEIRCILEVPFVLFFQLQC
jgi:hypothetical protein